MPTPRWELDALQIQPDRTGPYSILAAVYAAGERWPQLDAVLSDAEKTIPDNLTPYFRATVTLIGTGKDLTRAERYVRKYLSQEPEPNATNFAGAHYRLSQVLEKQDENPRPSPNYRPH